MSANDFLPRIQPNPTLPAPRRSAAFLPGYLQTSALTKFLAITADQLIQPSQLESISGYIGEKGGLYYNPSEDFYINEPTASRNDYQLEPTVVSVDDNKNINAIEFYQDLVNNLAFDGALTNNHSRLFSEEFYSWATPINPDMFVNFTNYFWVDVGPQLNTITDATDAVTDIIEQVNYTTASGLTLSSGMKIQFTNDANTEYNNINFIVEGVGNKISLINDDLISKSNQYDVQGYDTTPYDGYITNNNPDYWTIRRDSQDKNPWSRANRWFHKSVLGNVNNQTGIIQASRPIIEFLPNLELRNFARWARPDADYLSTNDTVLDIVGQSSYSIDGIALADGETILITGDPDATKNNQVYRVFGLNTFGKIGLTVVYDGLNNDGTPAQGEGILIKSGNTYAGDYYYYNGTDWVLGQQKTTANQPPVFNLYDLNANRLDSVTEYPSSDFNGNGLFNYVTNGTTIDPVLGINLSFTTFSSIEFVDLLTNTTYTYTSNNATANITGYYFYRQYTTPADLGLDNYLNDWHKSATPSRQLVHDEWIVTQQVDNLNAIEYPLYYNLSITPDANQLNLPYNSRVYLNGQILNSTTDYSITGNQLELSGSLTLAQNDILEAETWAETIPSLPNPGYFEIPSNLASNPNNQQIYTRSYNELAPQLISIIQNQTTLVGNPNGINNYRDTARDLSRGTAILNHTASLLRVGLFTSSNLKLTDAIRYSNIEYSTFFNKFLIKLQQFINQGYTDLINPAVWINDALGQINLGKNSTFPFAYSAMTSGNNYIPSTPAALGVMPVYLPSIFVDDTKITPTTVIRGHDGSITNAYGDYRDQVILAFEQEIYNAIDSSYINPDRVLEFDSLTVIPGYFRTTDYSRQEWLAISQPAFDRWTVRNRLDYVQNTTYDSANNLTWNYSQCTLPNGQFAPGHWRGIFKYFYDTYRPHVCPWEMLGFGQEPAWWATTYGPAPYTNQNVFMWTDIANGYIRNGLRQGVYSYLARPGLLNLLPVDNQGNKLDPIAIGLVTTTPNIIGAQANWAYGDLSPVENLWFQSRSYSFDTSEALFLAKPAKFVDIFWEARKLARDQGQIYDIDLGRRFGSADLHVHNEILTNGARAVVRGISNWVSDLLASLNLDIAVNFGDIERNLNTQLAYKAGSFIKQSTLQLNSDSFGLVPSENITTKLYTGASIAQPTYSAVIIIWDGSTYRVTGYDSVAQSFSILPRIENSSSSTVEVDTVTVEQYEQNSTEPLQIVYYTSLPSRQAVSDFLTGYQAYLESVGWQFQDYNTTTQQMKDFYTATNEFLSWSQVPLKAGDSIILSPISDNLVYNYSQGHVENIGQFVNGVYGILDRTGHGINTDQITVTRNTGQFIVTLNDNSVQGIYCLRLSLVEYEHALILDNTTDFGNLVYDPVLGIRQPRFELFVSRTKFWNGEPLANGYLVQTNDIVDNFETSVNNFRNFYNFDIDPSTGIQNSLAQHNIGYQQRPYLNNLILDNKTEFDYYKLFISAKGTAPSFTNILRNSYITKTAGFDILEEWAFLIGEYGNTERKSAIEIQVKPSNFTTNPQAIDFVNVVGTDPTIIDLTPNDPRWILKNQKNTTNNQFNYRDYTNTFSKDLPNAGYVQVNETTYTVLNTTALTDINTGLFSQVVYTDSSTFKDGDTIWQIIVNNGGWTVYRVCESAQILSIETGANPSDPTVFTLNTTATLNPNDIIFLQQTTSTSGELQGVQTVLNTQANSPTLANNQFSINVAIDTGIVYPSVCTGTITNPVFAIGDQLSITVALAAPVIVTLTDTGITQTVADINAALIDSGNTTTTATITQTNQLQITDSLGETILLSGSVTTAAGLPTLSSLTGQNVYVLKEVRFADTAALNAFSPPLGWLKGDLVFVDNNGIDLWTVFLNTADNYDTPNWTVARTETDKIDTEQVYTAYIYDSITNQDVIQLELYDPYKGLIFPAADAELEYKLDYDPAQYTDGDAAIYQINPNNSWGNAEVGQLWWDLSTTRFLEYEQGSLEYKKKYWGQVAPGVQVDIYEWVKSPVTPEDWPAYVLAQANTGTNRPTGTPIYDATGTDTPYVTITAYDPLVGSDVTNYYFWVLAPNTIQDGQQFRNLDAASVAQLIQNNSQSIAWFAPVATNAFLVNNIDTYINDQSSVLQITFFTQADDSIIHKQWILQREFDQINSPYIALWNKMRDSLVGFDDMNLSVPDPTLSSVIKYGNSIRPRQTWFEDRLQARLQFFQKANQLLAVNNVTAISGYLTGLTISDPLPDPTQYDFEVLTTADRIALQNTIPAGKKVLVESDQQLNGYWTLWLYNSATSWTLLEQQQYRATDYWVYTDWYSIGYSATTAVNYTWADISTMTANVAAYTTGDLIKVLNNGSNEWAIYLFSLDNNTPQYTAIAQQNGTIAFLSTLSNYNIANSSLDLAVSTVTKSFISSLLNDLLDITDINQLFFSMVHYVHYEQTIVPWVFKTSTVYGQGLSLSFTNDYILPADENNNLENFFSEAKPYHVKLRELTEKRRNHADIANVQVTDTRLWNIHLIYDRVTGASVIPNNANPANYTGQPLTAADRIQLYYAPTEGMPPKVLEQLISRTEFGGTVIDGKTFYQFGAMIAAGYDNSSYDDNVLGGYDFTADQLENFYDVYINGGDPLGQPAHFNAVAETNSTINLDGNKFIQPYLDSNHPEELVPLRVGDAVVIDVYTFDTETVASGYDTQGYDTDQYDGATGTIPVSEIKRPPHLVNKIIGDNTTGPFKIGQLPQSQEAVFVSKNGVLLQNIIDYTINWTNQTITTTNTVTSSDTLNIASFGVGGGAVVAKKLYYNTSDTVFDIGNNITDSSYVFVMVDGQYSGIDGTVNFTTSGTQVTIINPTPSNSTVLIVLFNSPFFSTIVTENFTATGGANTFSLDSSALSTNPPLLTTDVYKNGLRLAQAPVINYTQDSTTTVFSLPTTAISTADINVWRNGILLKQGTDYSATTTSITLLATPIANQILTVQVAEGGEYSIPPTIAVGSIINPDFTVAILGDAINPTFVPNSQIVINGIGIVVAGTTLTDVINAITAASIPGITATNVTNQLQITSTVGQLTLNGNVVTQAELIHTANYSLSINGINTVLTGNTLAQAIIDINNTNITGVTATNNGGFLEIINSNGLITFSGNVVVAAGLPLVVQNQNVTVNSTVAGDLIQVTTYTQDASYQMWAESLLGDNSKTYQLGVKPYNIDSLSIYYNGLLLTFGKDYKLIDTTTNYDSETDITGQGFINATYNIQAIIATTPATPNSITDNIVIQLFAGLPAKAPIGLRIYKDIFGNYQYLRISDANSTILTQPLLSTDRIVVVKDATVLAQPNVDSMTPGVVFINGERITYWAVNTLVPGYHELLQCMRGTGGTGINPNLSAGQVVRDAGSEQILPGNRWDWVYNPDGLEYSNSLQAEFLQLSPGSPTFNG